MPGIPVHLNPGDDPIQLPADFVDMLREDLGDVSDDAIAERIKTWFLSGDLDAERFRRFLVHPLNREA